MTEEKLLHELRKAYKGQRHLLKKIRKLEKEKEKLWHLVRTYEPTAIYKVSDGQIIAYEFNVPLTKQEVRDLIIFIEENDIMYEPDDE